MNFLDEQFVDIKAKYLAHLPPIGPVSTGPWKWEHKPVLGAVDGCEISTPSAYIGVVYTRADAHLVSAAPDLLAALKLAREALKANEDISGTWNLYQQSPEMQAINAAIAKAEG